MKKQTIDIELKWQDLCRIADRGQIRAIELMPACKVADILRQAQKEGKKSVTFTFENGEVKVNVY